MKNFTLHKLVTAFNPSQIPQINIDRIVFLAGRSNVGKSSLINALFKQKNLAKVSAKPGKTRSLNFYYTEQGVVLVDMPGYGFALGRDKTNEDWQELIHQTLKLYAKKTEVFILLDSRRGFMKTDQETLDYFSNWEIPYTLIITKCDKLNISEKSTLKRELESNKDLNFVMISMLEPKTVELVYEKFSSYK